jgi:hypothetical protein
VFSKRSRLILGPNVPPTHGVKRPDHKADQSPPASTAVKKVYRYISIHHICIHGLHRDKIPLTFLH